LILPYLITFLFWLIIIFSKKHLSLLEMYTTSFFSLYFESICNIFLDLKYDYFGYFRKGADWSILPILFFMYPAVNILFLNFFPFQYSILKKILYIGICSMISIMFEWLFLHTSFFYYNGWKLLYSALLYPVIFIILLSNLSLIRMLYKKSIQQHVHK